MNENQPAKTPYELGQLDGAAAFAESGSFAAPVDGWDGDLINAIGFEGVCILFGLDVGTERGGWSENGTAALKEYCRGCDNGAFGAHVDQLFATNFPNAE